MVKKFSEIFFIESCRLRRVFQRIRVSFVHCAEVSFQRRTQLVLPYCTHLFRLPQRCLSPILCQYPRKARGSAHKDCIGRVWLLHNARIKSAEFASSYSARASVCQGIISANQFPPAPPYPRFHIARSPPISVAQTSACRWRGHLWPVPAI